jgi:ribosomal protein S12 methylthiotransferase
MSSLPKTVGMVSLGCPKALVDSERLLTRLKSEGYGTASAYAASDVVIVNTCAFIDSAREESFEAIAEARASGRPVVVTGCLRFPDLAAITGAHQYDAVMGAVHKVAPPPSLSTAPVMPPAGIKLTPRHYAYLKVAEGCDHRCSFCIIPSLRGDLVSRPIAEVLAEAEALAASGVKELLVVAQDTSAYGLDLGYAEGEFRGATYRADLEGLARGLGELGVWVRLHYVYPYPHVDRILPLMAEGKILPYLDIPFQHASPKILKAMRRPANEARTLERLAAWRAIVPDIALRSTFVVGFPGETEADFQHLLDWLDEAQLDRVGAFAYENVVGATARDLPGHVPEEVKQERRARFMAAAAKISRSKLRAKVGKTLEVVVDAVRPDGVAVARSRAEAPDIDGHILVEPGGRLRPGERLKVKVHGSDDFDLYAAPTDLRLRTLGAAPQRLHRVIARR